MNFLKKPFILIFKIFKLTGKNLTSLHKMIWGTGWKRLILAIIVSAVVFALILSTTLDVTSRPGFCSTCHYMKPYYESWKDSTHKDVTCTDCHFPPGLKNKLKGKFTAVSMVVNYFTGVYKKSKPWAEISDKSCLRSGCHETRKLKGEVKFKKNIIFDHAPHLENLRRKKQLRCTSCHSQIVQGSHLSVTESSCFLCHFKNPKDNKGVISKCTKCHIPPVKKEGKNKNIVYDHTNVLAKKIGCYKCHGNMVVGDGAVPKDRCNNCHAEQDKIDQYDQTELMHKNHITDHKIECKQCHTEIQHKSIARTEEITPECNSCHTDPHKLQLMMFTGKGGKNVPNHPSAMFETGLNCQACHQYHNFSVSFKEKGDTMVASGLSCEPCHGKGYNKILENWKIQTDKRVMQLDRILDKVKTEIKKIKEPEIKNAAEKKLSDAIFNFKMVKFGNSIHNISFSNKLLEQSFKLALESLGKKKNSVKLPHYDHESDIVPGECSNCHMGIERTTVKAFGWDFPHYKHLVQQNISCKECHSNAVVHGRLITKKEDCMSCHHDKKQKKKCKACHETQNMIFNSKLDFSTFNIPNVMIEDIECSDCHVVDSGIISKPGKEKCSDCHEEDYEEMYIEWRSETIKLLGKLEKKVRKLNLKKGDKAFDLLILLNRDGSNGIHNPELYEKLIRNALK